MADTKEERVASTDLEAARAAPPATRCLCAGKGDCAFCIWRSTDHRGVHVLTIVIGPDAGSGATVQGDLDELWPECERTFHPDTARGRAESILAAAFTMIPELMPPPEQEEENAT